MDNLLKALEDLHVAGGNAGGGTRGRGLEGRGVAVTNTFNINVRRDGKEDPLPCSSKSAGPSLLPLSVLPSIPVRMEDMSFDKTLALHAQLVEFFNRYYYDFTNEENVAAFSAEMPLVMTERSGFSNRIFSQPEPSVPPPARRHNNIWDHLRRRLLIWDLRYVICDTIREHRVTIISGDPGVGKTTQVPQYILEDATGRDEFVRVVCVVPRRIAAVAMATRVAKERGEPLGDYVGYQVRLEGIVSPYRGVLTYCTPSMLLRALTTLDYSVMKNVTHIVVDELHERDRQTELLLACLKCLVAEQFPSVRLILMGGELDFCMWQKYFTFKDGNTTNIVPVVQVKYANYPQSRLSPVQTLFLEEILSSLGLPHDPEAIRNSGRNTVSYTLITKILELIHTQLAPQDPGKAVLILLPGYEEILEAKFAIFRDPSFESRADDFIVFPLHSSLTSGDEKGIFEASSDKGKRKIILATSIAESSLTIEDVAFVIDTGLQTLKTFDNSSAKSEVRTVKITKVQAQMREGRAGRGRPGVCFRLYTEKEFQDFRPHQDLNVCRSTIHQLCLLAKAFCRSGKPIWKFINTMIQPPGQTAVDYATAELCSIGAFDCQEKLTQLGLYLLDFPIEPYLGKAVMLGVAFKCLDPILSITTLISHGEPFILAEGRDEANKIKDKKAFFAQGALSDHGAWLKAFHEWERVSFFPQGCQYAFCSEFQLSCGKFEMMCALRSLILGEIRASGFVHQPTGPNDLKELNKNSDNWPLVKAILVATFFPNLAFLNKDDSTWNTLFDAGQLIDSSSVAYSCFKPTTDFAMYAYLGQEDRGLKQVTLVTPLTAALFSNMDYFNLGSTIPGRLDHDTLSLFPFHGNGRMGSSKKIYDEDATLFLRFVSLKGKRGHLSAIAFLRSRLIELINRRLSYPTANTTQWDEKALDLVCEILQDEDAAAGLKTLEGVGQWPKLVTGNMMSAPRSGFSRQMAVHSANADDDEEPRNERGPSTGRYEY